MINLVILQAAKGGNAGMINLLMIGLMFVVFYFFLIRPQSKKAKEQDNFIANLKVGDKVITIAGIHGKIVSINEEDKTFTIQVDGPTRLKIEQSAISLEMSKKVANSNA
ncbi:MAG: preprotein translocase subunit YajC [Chitinophagales bacterium]|nr:preprotein translocase subunit YajC [Chitinophagales bacterium]